MTSCKLQLPLRLGPIAVRWLLDSDLHELYRIEADPIIKQFIIGGPVTEPEEQWIAGIRGQTMSESTLGLEHVATGAFAGRGQVGHYGGTMNPAHREVDVVIDRQFWGQRLGRPACQLLCALAFNVHRASSTFAVVHPKHEASLALVDDLRFVEVGSRLDDRGEVKARIFELSRSAYNRVLQRTWGTSPDFNQALLAEID